MHSKWGNQDLSSRMFCLASLHRVGDLKRSILFIQQFVVNICQNAALCQLNSRCALCSLIMLWFCILPGFPVGIQETPARSTTQRLQDGVQLSCVHRATADRWCLPRWPRHRQWTPCSRGALQRQYHHCKRSPDVRGGRHVWRERGEGRRRTVVCIIKEPLIVWLMRHFVFLRIIVIFFLFQDVVHVGRTSQRTRLPPSSAAQQRQRHRWQTQFRKGPHWLSCLQVFLRIGSTVEFVH